MHGMELDHLVLGHFYVRHEACPVIHIRIIREGRVRRDWNGRLSCDWDIEAEFGRAPQRYCMRMKTKSRLEGVLLLHHVSRSCTENGVLLAATSKQHRAPPTPPLRATIYIHGTVSNLL